MIRRCRMNALAFWGLCPTFSIVQAAFLFCGRDPSDIDRQNEWKTDFHPIGYVPVKTSLLNAVTTGRLKSQIRFEYHEEHGPSDDVDIHYTQIAREDLDEFFDKGGIPGHFFGRGFKPAGASGATAQLPPKLNAALRAWTAVTSEPRLLRGKSPKQAMRAWLVEHADELGLRKRDGEINEAGIQEICKVANWRPEGGATPTPEPLPPPPMPAPVQATDYSTYDPSLEDEIPF